MRYLRRRAVDKSIDGEVSKVEKKTTEALDNNAKVRRDLQEILMMERAARARRSK